MPQITTTNRQAILELIAQADETVEINGLSASVSHLLNFISVDVPSGVATFSASASITNTVTDGTNTSTQTIIPTEINSSITDGTSTNSRTWEYDADTHFVSDGIGTQSTILVQAAGITSTSTDGVNTTTESISPTQIELNSTDGSITNEIILDIINGIDISSSDGTNSALHQINTSGFTTTITDGTNTSTESITTTDITLTLSDGIGTQSVSTFEQNKITQQSTVGDITDSLIISPDSNIANSTFKSEDTNTGVYSQLVMTYDNPTFETVNGLDSASLTLAAGSAVIGAFDGGIGTQSTIEVQPPTIQLQTTDGTNTSTIDLANNGDITLTSTDGTITITDTKSITGSILSVNNITSISTISSEVGKNEMKTTDNDFTIQDTQYSNSRLIKAENIMTSEYANITLTPTTGAIALVAQNGGPFGYTSSTINFTQSSTTGVGSDIDIDITFDANGNIDGYTINNAGKNYIVGEIITLTNAGSGSPAIEAFTLANNTEIDLLADNFQGKTGNMLIAPHTIYTSVSDANYGGSGQINTVETNGDYNISIKTENGSGDFAKLDLTSALQSQLMTYNDTTGENTTHTITTTDGILTSTDGTWTSTHAVYSDGNIDAQTLDTSGNINTFSLGNTYSNLEIVDVNGDKSQTRTEQQQIINRVFRGFSGEVKTTQTWSEIDTKAEDLANGNYVRVLQERDEYTITYYDGTEIKATFSISTTSGDININSASDVNLTAVGKVFMDANKVEMYASNYILLDGKIQFSQGLTTSTPTTAGYLYRDASGFVKIKL